MQTVKFRNGLETILSGVNMGSLSPIYKKKQLKRLLDLKNINLQFISPEMPTALMIKGLQNKRGCSANMILKEIGAKHYKDIFNDLHLFTKLWVMHKQYSNNI